MAERILGNTAKDGTGATYYLVCDANGVLQSAIAAGGIVDGADITQGAKADSAVTDPASSASVVSLLKGLLKKQAGRKGYVLHRDITVQAVNTPVAPTLADVGTGGSLAFNTNYKVAVAAKAPYYWSAPSTVANVTTANDAANTHVVRITLAQVPNATSYMVFMSTAAAPAFIAEITETQRAAGGCRITALNTVDNAGAGAAGTVDILVTSTANLFPTTAFTQSTYAPDMIVPVQVSVASDVATGGTLLPNTQYAVGICTATRYGFSKSLPTIAVTTANDASSTHCVQLTIPQTPDADYYHLFCSAGASGSNPLYVGTITESQRAAGGARVTGFGIVDAAGSNPAGTVLLCVIGSGLAINVSPFSGGLAWPFKQNHGVTPIDCTGYSKARIAVECNPLQIYSASITVATVMCEINPLTGELIEMTPGSITFFSGGAQPGRVLVGPSGSGTNETLVYGLNGLVILLGVAGSVSTNVKVYVDLY